jgi:hypothetical protein
VPFDRLTTGPCSGYWRDHVMTLACGGPDAVSNMQRQTTAMARAKDAWERRLALSRLSQVSRGHHHAD